MKNITITLALGLSLLATACGGGGKTQKDDSKTDSAATEKKEIKEEASAPKDTAKFELTDAAKPFAKRWRMTEYSHTDGKKETVKGERDMLLNPDGTFAETFAGKEIATGKWSVKDKNLMLMHLTGEMKDKAETLTVKEISAARLVTLDDDGKMTETFVAVENKK